MPESGIDFISGLALRVKKTRRHLVVRTVCIMISAWLAGDGLTAGEGGEISAHWSEGSAVGQTVVPGGQYASTTAWEAPLFLCVVTVQAWIRYNYSAVPGSVWHQLHEHKGTNLFCHTFQVSTWDTIHVSDPRTSSTPCKILQQIDRENKLANRW